MNEYILGQAITLQCEMRDLGDRLIDASALRLLVLRPGASASEVVNVSQLSTGRVQGVYVPDTPGEWRYRFETTGGIPAAEEESFLVLPRQVPAP